MSLTKTEKTKMKIETMEILTTIQMIKKETKEMTKETKEINKM
jgi:hypothetical protein